jgi:purine-binding chemotaxis protein CheW
MEALSERTLAAGLLKQLISFTVGEEQYGLELLRVKEVIRTRQITWLPRAPICVKGVINLRGEVIPIIDLRDRLRLQSIEQTAMTRVIVVEVEGQSMGVVVDSASQVVQVPADEFDPAPLLTGKKTRELIIGVAKMEGRLIILLDVDRILNREEIGHIADSLEHVSSRPGLSEEMKGVET